MLRTLLYKAYLRPSVVSQTSNPRDKEISYELNEVKGDRNIKTPKQLKEIKERVALTLADEERAQWEGGTMDAGGVLQGGSGRLGLLVRVVAGCASYSTDPGSAAETQGGQAGLQEEGRRRRVVQEAKGRERQGQGGARLAGRCRG